MSSWAKSWVKWLCEMATTSSAPSTRKRKIDALSSSPDVPISAAIFPMFSPPRSPRIISLPDSSPKGNSPKKMKLTATGSSVSPSKRKSSLMKQGASQNNKIFRYLQPKRLLSSFETQEPSQIPPASLPGKQTTQSEDEDKDKENKFLDLKVTLVRIEESSYQDHSYCLMHRSPIKFCCNAAAESCIAAESAVTMLCDQLYEDLRNPCRRLGIPVPDCVSPVGCIHHEAVGVMSSEQDNVYSTMLNSDLKLTMIRSAYNKLSKETYPTPLMFHRIFSLMKESADKNVVALGRSFLKRAVECFPPCSIQSRNHYIHVLHSPHYKVINPSGLWALRSFDLFDEILLELEKFIEGLLNPSQLRDKMKTAGMRKITRPKRFRDFPSPQKTYRRSSRQESKDFYEVCDMNTEVFNMDMGEEALKKRKQAEDDLRSMSSKDKTDHIFHRFEVLVDILERDLVIWLTKNLDCSKIRDRTVCPLIVLALWRPEADTGYDSVHCRRIFAIYGSAWMLKFHPHHLRTLSRLIGLIAEITAVSEPNIANVYPTVGDGRANLSRKLCDVLQNSQMEECRTQAVDILMPEWLKMLVSASLLRIPPTVSSMDMPALLEPMGENTLHLWVCFIEGILGFYHTRDTMKLLKQVSYGYKKLNHICSKPSPSIVGPGINFKVLLREISAYYQLSSNLNKSASTAFVPTVLRELLTF